MCRGNIPLNTLRRLYYRNCLEMKATMLETRREWPSFMVLLGMRLLLFCGRDGCLAMIGDECYPVNDQPPW